MTMADKLQADSAGRQGGSTQPFAQVDAFTCRDNCREQWRLNGGTAAVEVCRATFRECVKACPPAQ